MRLRSLALALILALCAVAATAETPKNNSRKERWVPGQVLVKYRSGFAPEGGKHGINRSKKAFDRFRLKGKAQQHAAARGLDRVYVIEVDDVHAALARFAKDPNIEYAEPNWVIELSAVPNDPSYSAQWSLDKIGAPAAWDTATSGSGVVIGVVDTGIDLTHPDLAANLWTNPGEIAANNIDDDGNGFIDDVHGWDFASDDADPTDTNGHGTMVAGVIGAVGNNATGVSGVAWTAKLAALRIGTGTASVYAAVEAIQYANAMGFRITSNSYGWWEGGQSFLFDDVIAAAEAQGNLFVAAAGNEGHDNDQLPAYPSHYDNANVISVTATTASDALWSSGNYGARSVDLGAPGVAIETTARGGGYTNGSGTSFAAPLVAGAAALYWTANPSLTAAQVRDALLLHSEPVPTLNQTTVSGGRLSLSNLFDTETTAPDAISDVTVLDTTFRSVTLRFTASGDDGATGRAARYDVRVSTSPLNASNWAQATQLAGEPIPALPGTLENFRLTGLDASTTYYLGVRAIDNAGNSGALSNVVTFTTTRAAVLFDDNVEGGARDWTVAGTDGNGGAALWHIRNGEWSYAKPNGGTYDTGAANSGTLTSRAIDLTSATDARLQFRHDLWTQRTWGRDVAQVQVSVDGGAWQTVLLKLSTDYEHRTESIDLSAYDGHSIRVRFAFDTVDSVSNAYPGWQVDDVRVEATSANAPPVAVIGAPAVTEDQAATLTSSGSSDPEGASLEYKWSFGDGTFVYTNATSIAHTWTREGTYTVALTAFDGSNSSDPVTVTITPVPVNDPPMAVVSMSAGSLPPYLEETNIYVNHFGSSDEEGAPLTCRYDYGDGRTLDQVCVGSLTPHQWMTPGTYTITLIVNDGVQDSLPGTRTITIQEASNDKPVARVGGPYDAHPNETVTLDGTASSDEETSVASYLWTFPDGTTSAAPQPAKAFATSGNHDVSLVVTDQTSVASTPATARVRVCGGATASFFSNPIYTCPGGTAKVGVNVGSAILPLTLTWTDGYVQQITSLFNGYYAERVVTPSGPATYNLATLTDFLGCAGTVGTTTANVGFATATLSGSRTICRGQSTTLEAQFTGNGPFNVTWSDGFTATYTNGFGTHTVAPTETTVYSISSMTCASCPPGTTGVTTGTYTVNVVDPVSALMSGGGNSCNGSAVAVTVTISGGVPPYSVQWSDGSVVSTATNTATRFFTPAATTTYTATVTSASCSAPVTGSATVTVSTGTAPAVTSVTGGGSFCPGSGPATLTANLAGDGLPFTLTWSDGYVQTTETLTATRTVSPASSTGYRVTAISNAFGCAGTATGGTATVSPRQQPTAVVSGGGAFCAGTSQTISVAFTGAGPFFITWSDGVTQSTNNSSITRSVTPSSATTYTIASLNDNFCAGTSSGSAAFTPLPRPTAVITGGGGYCAGSTSTLTATLTGTAPFTLTWNDGTVQTVESGTVATRQVSPAASTNYFLSAVRDATCTGTSSGSVTAFPRSVANANVTGGGNYCTGSTSTVNVAVTGGSAPFNITWSDGVTQTLTGSFGSRQVNPESVTAYTITAVTDAYCSGGTSSGSATVTPRARPAAVVSGGGYLCNGIQTVTATLTGTAPFTVTWSDGNIQQTSSSSVSRTVSTGSSTTFTVTALSDAYCNGGTSSGSATVTARPEPTATVSGGGSFCAAGGSATIGATFTGIAPFTIVWSDGVTETTSANSTSRAVAPAVQTEYRITSFTDAYCSRTAAGTAMVYPRAAPTATLSGGGTFCAGTAQTMSVALTGFAPFTLTWSDGLTQTVNSGTSATRSVTPATATTYTIASVRDFFCTAGTASGSAAFIPVAKPTAAISGGGDYCPGGSSTVTATLTGAAPFSLTWNDGFTQTVASGNVATRQVSPASYTTYLLSAISDASSCTGTSSGSAWAAPRPAPAATVTGGGNSCGTGTVQIGATLTGTAPYTVTWSDGVTQTTAPSVSSVYRNVNPASATTYTITAVSDAYCSGGTSSGSAIVTPRAVPAAVVTGGGNSCGGASVTIGATLTGTAPFTLTWNDGVTQTIPSGNTATRSVNPASATTYQLNSFTDAYCTGTRSGSAVVTPRPAPTAAVSGSGTYCDGTSRAISAALTGTAPFSLTWSDGFTQTIPSGNVATRNVSPASPTTYSVTAISDAYCSGTASGSATVTRIAAPAAVVSGGGSFCSTTSITATLTGTAPFSVTWSDGVTQSTSASSVTRTVSPASTTVYTVTQISDASCANGTSTGSATATRVAAPSAQVSGGGTYCAGSPVTVSAALSGTGPFNITWSDGFTQQVTGTTATRAVSPSSTTTYSITSIANDSCSGTANGSATVIPRATPTAVVSGGGTYCEGATTNITATFTGSAPFSVTWSDGVTGTTSSNTLTRSVGPSATTVYTLTSFTDAYCSGTRSGSATATPTLKPVITTQPQSKTIAYNTATTLTVVASGTGLNYQWYKGPAGTTTTPVGTASSYTTPKLKVTTQYWVKIWKTGCTAYPTNSQTATVTIP